jgi:hypothetical protein
MLKGPRADLDDGFDGREHEMVDVPGQIYEAARAKPLRAVLVKLVAGPEVKLPGDNRHALAVRVLVSRDLVAGRHLQTDGKGPDFPGSPDKTAIWLPFGRTGGAGPHLIASTAIP